MPNGATMQRQPQSQPQPAGGDSIPSKRDLTSWWKQFKKNSRREEEKVEPPPAGVFGVELSISIRYANVAISLFDANGESFTYGYVPIIVAKCGVYLKEKATETPGIFRVAGAERRLRELQVIFNSPDRYGKGLDWSGYTVHDAANILRRYLNLLPEPIIPLEFYERFRDPLRHHQAQAVGEQELQLESRGDFDPNATIRAYQLLITELPPLNRQLLLYILDLLAVFSSKADINLMPASNLAAIFSPCLLSHPTHAMSPLEYRLSQDVLIFLIENQDNFLVGMQGTEVDQQTIQDVQSGVHSPARSPATPTTPKSRTQQIVGRSASTASAGSESVRRYGGVRRNMSVNSRNSRHSRQSNNAPSPVEATQTSPLTPSSKAGGIHRSNTVPSKKSGSPALNSPERFQPQMSAESPDNVSAATPAIPAIPSPLASGADVPVIAESVEMPSKAPEASLQSSTTTPNSGRNGSTVTPNVERDLSNPTGLNTDLGPPSGPTSPSAAASRGRVFSSFFRRSPSAERDRSEGRRPNKLQKRRPQDEPMTGSTSQASLSGGSHPPSPGVQPFPGTGQASFSALEESLAESRDTPIAQEQRQPQPPAQDDTHAQVSDSTSHVVAQDTSEASLKSEVAPAGAALGDPALKVSEGMLKPEPSPAGSLTSRSSRNEMSAAENDESDANTETKERRHHRWKLSISHKKAESKLENETTLAPVAMGATPGAQRSTSSISSLNKPRKSINEESTWSGGTQQTTVMSDSEDRPVGEKTTEKRGLTGWFRGKLQERKEREAEKERAKSPPPAEHSEQLIQKPSLSVVAEGEAAPADARPTAENTAASQQQAGTQRQSSGVPVDASGQP